MAAELATLLPRLPRVKITPETITQTTIDRWYGYETEYRQTIAELRAELAAANERAGKAQARLAEIGKVEVEWGYWHEDEFNISERQFSAADVRYYREQSGRPVERCLAGEWRKVGGDDA